MPPGRAGDVGWPFPSSPLSACRPHPLPISSFRTSLTRLVSPFARSSSLPRPLPPSLTRRRLHDPPLSSSSPSPVNSMAPAPVKTFWKEVSLSPSVLDWPRGHQRARKSSSGVTDRSVGSEAGRDSRLARCPASSPQPSPVCTGIRSYWFPSWPDEGPHASPRDAAAPLQPQRSSFLPQHILTLCTSFSLSLSLTSSRSGESPAPSLAFSLGP